MSFEIIVDANTEPTATTKTKSKALSLESVRLPDPRSRIMSAAKPMIESVTVLPTLYQLSKKNGACGIAGCSIREFTRTRWESTGIYAGIAPPDDIFCLNEQARILPSVAAHRGHESWSRQHALHSSRKMERSAAQLTTPGHAGADGADRDSGGHRQGMAHLLSHSEGRRTNPAFDSPLRCRRRNRARRDQSAPT